MPSEHEETDRRSYASLAELQDALFRYIHGFYNVLRPHSSATMGFHPLWLKSLLLNSLFFSVYFIDIGPSTESLVFFLFWSHVIDKWTIKDSFTLDDYHDCPHHTAEVLLTIMASLVQQESESLSKNVKIGIQCRFQQRKVMVNTRCFPGYNKDDEGHLIINPAPA